MRLCVLVLTGLFFTAAHAQSEPLAQTQRVSILSWNIYMLPGFLGTGKLQRSEALGNVLSASEYDVIVFQEAFYAPARRKIRNLLKAQYPFEAGPANAKRFSLRTNSGLWIFSKFPIVHQQEIMFETRYGVDALSRKGALLVELDVRGQRMQVIATHLQNAGQATLRQSQCEELFQRLLQPSQKPGVPQIICGDFNIDRYSANETYQQMLDILHAKDADVETGAFSYDRVANDLDVEPGTKRELIDFILTRENASNVQRVKHAIKIFKQRWHSNHQDLSDHYAIETKIEFRNDVTFVTASSIP